MRVRVDWCMVICKRSLLFMLLNIIFKKINNNTFVLFCVFPVMLLF